MLHGGIRSKICECWNIQSIAFAEDICFVCEWQLGKNKYFHRWRGCPSGKDKIDEQMSIKTNEEMNTKQIMSCELYSPQDDDVD
jgi:hypothetical protein